MSHCADPFCRCQAAQRIPCRDCGAPISLGNSRCAACAARIQKTGSR